MARSRRGPTSKKPTVVLKLRPNKFMKAVGDVLEKNMEVATVFVRDEVKKKINRGQPTRQLRSGSIIGLDPSKPGEPPKKITGQLQNSIRGKVVRTTRRIVGLVGTNLKKGKWLELGTRKMKPRPYLRPTIMENRRKIKRIIVKGHGAL